MKRIQLLFILVLCFFNSCDQKKLKEKPQIPEQEIKNDVPEKKLDKLTDSLSVPSFSVQVILSEKAANKIRLENQEITVTANFIESIPYDKNEKFLEFESIGLGNFNRVLSDSTLAIFRGIKLPKTAFMQPDKLDYQILIEVTSGNPNFLNSTTIEVYPNQISENHSITMRLINE